MTKIWISARHLRSRPVFAAHGSEETRAAMYQAFERLGFPDAGLVCAEQIVILDGLSGLLLVMRSFGKVPADERPWQFDSLIAELERHHGNKRLAAEPDGFVQEWRDDE